jgi:asparaginyl-tRNA synthetase
MNKYIFLTKEQIEQNLGEPVEIKGWVFNFRSSGKIWFLQIRDGHGFIQAVVSKNDIPDRAWEDCQRITPETSVELSGTIKKDDRSPFGYEMQVADLKIVQVADEYPIAKKEHGPDFLLDNRHLWLRSPSQGAIQKIRHTIIDATCEFLKKNDFTRIDSPVLTPSACEGTTTLFEIDYFGQPAYLSQSGQLYLEAAIFSFGRCYDFGPVFRAEKSKTRRHLIEFWMMDAEMAFVEHEENLAMQENLIAYIIAKVLERNKEELKVLERDTSALEKIKPPFIRKTYSGAVKELREMGSDITEGEDLGANDETTLTKKYNQPVFVEKFPSAIKAFYMKRDPNNEKFALCSDLLAPEGYGEIIGGSQREENYDILLERIKEHNLPVENFQWYLDLRKYGSVPHSGFGYGLERIVTWICGLKHVRTSIPFPRMLNRIKP